MMAAATARMSRASVCQGLTSMTPKHPQEASPQAAFHRVTAEKRVKHATAARQPARGARPEHSHRPRAVSTRNQAMSSGREVSREVSAVGWVAS